MRSFFSSALVAALLLVPCAAGAQTLATGAPADTFTFSDYFKTLPQLTDFRFLPDGRLVVISKDGHVKLMAKGGGAITDAGSFPVSTTSEQGLLGVEVHPDFPTNHILFFYYSRSSTATTDPGTDVDRHRVVSVVLKDDGTLDMTTEKILMRGLRGPANHDGGALAVSKDRHLFIGDGDTGCNCNCAPGTNMSNSFATCLTNPNGKISRINLDGTIPADNPLIGKTVTACGDTCGTQISMLGTSTMPRTEIWNWGFRNPFRIWSDPVTGYLWVGDVGEITWEEVDVVKGGGHHYGWPEREGFAGQPATWCTTIQPNNGNCIDPVYACPRADCQAIIGGQIVDSCDWPDAFKGLYFFGDEVTNKLYTLKVNATRDGVDMASRAHFADFNGPTAIHAGPDGALYVSSINGKITRFAVKSPVTCPSPPDAGPETGPDATVDDGSVTDTGVDDGSVAIDSSSADDAGADGANADTGTSGSGGCGCELPGRSNTSRHEGVAAAITGLIALAAVRAARRRS